MPKQEITPQTTNQDDAKPILIDLDVGKPKKITGKITNTKRKQFLEYYSETGNMAGSAAKIGFSRQAIWHLINRDEKFKTAFQYIEDHFTDAIESISITQALLPREGFQDRRLQLQARRPEKYNPKQSIELNQAIQINVDTAPVEARQILDKQAIIVE